MTTVDNRDMADVVNYQEARIEALRREVERLNWELRECQSRLAYVNDQLTRVLTQENVVGGMIHA